MVALLAAALVAFAVAVVVLATHRRRALFALAAPPLNVPTPNGTLPLLGDALEVLRNRHRLHDWLLDTTLALSKSETEEAQGERENAAAAAAAGQPPPRSLLPRTWAFTTPFNPIYLVISSPSALEHVLSSSGMHNYVKGPEFSARLGQLLGRGIFCADGEEWRWQRKLAAHMFSAAQFRSHVASAFSVSVEHLFEALEPRARADKGKDAGVVDLHALMYDLTLDTFSRIGFGVELGLLEAAAVEARGGAADGSSSGRGADADRGSAAAGGGCAINGVSGREFARAFDEAQRLANRRFWLPLWRLCEVLMGDAGRVRADVAVVRAFAQGIVRQRRQLLDKAAGLAKGGGGGADAGGRPDLLALFMRPGALASSAAARFGGGEEGNGSAGGANGNGGNGRAAPESEGEGELTDAEVVDACLNFIIAGRDTTAQATSWAFYELARHPDAEARLLAEAEAVLSPPPSPAAAPGAAAAGAGAGAGPQDEHDQQNHPTYDQLRQLRYARAVFLESVRLHPSVPQDCKFALNDDVLPDGTPVPRGALMLYSPYVVCRLPSFWGPDADEFRPERWLKEGGGNNNESGGGGGASGGGGGGAGFLAPSPYAFPAFNAGPRLCLGRGFAELEGVYALVETLRRYRFVLAPPCDKGVTYEQSTSLPMLGGLKVRVMPR